MQIDDYEYNDSEYNKMFYSGVICCVVTVYGTKTLQAWGKKHEANSGLH